MLINEHKAAEHQLFRIRFTELNEIFAVMSLRSFAISMIGIFVPIYLYNVGYTIRQILLVYILMYVGEMLLEFFAANLILKVGPKHVIAYSLPFLITHFILLKTIPIYHWPIWLISFTGSITLAFFWQAYHFDFSRCKSKNNVTSDISKLYITLAILGAFAPFIGGYVATNFGITNLFLVVILLLIVATFPLFGTGEKERSQKIDLKKIKFKKIARDLISYGGSGMEGSAALNIWPLFIFLIVGTYEKVGFVTSTALVLTIAVNYFIGKRTDNRNRCKYIRYGSLLNGLIYFFQAFANTLSHVLVINIIRSFIHSIHAAPYISEYYLHADENSRSEYIMMMESAIDFSRILMLSTLFIMTFYFPDKTVLMFGLILGGLGTLLVGIMPPSTCEVQLIDNKTIKVSPRLQKVK